MRCAGGMVGQSMGESAVQHVQGVLEEFLLFKEKSGMGLPWGSSS